MMMFWSAIIPIPTFCAIRDIRLDMKTLVALRLLAGTLLLGALSTTSAAQENLDERPRLNVEIVAGPTFPSAGGNFSVSIFQRLPFSSSELGIRPAFQPQTKLIWNLNKRHTIGVAWSMAEFAGDRRVFRETYLLGVLRFRFNERVVSRADLRQWRAFYEYRIDLNKRLALLPQLELRVASIHGSLAIPEARRPLEESVSRSFMGPVAGIALQYRSHKRCTLEVRASGSGGYGFRILETDAQLRIRASARAVLVSGWKYSSYSYSRNINDFDVLLHQPYVGIAFGW